MKERKSFLVVCIFKVVPDNRRSSVEFVSKTHSKRNAK